MRKITSLLALLGILFFAQNVHAQGGKKYGVFGVEFTAAHYSDWSTSYNSSNAVDRSYYTKYWSNSTLKNTDYFLVDLGEVKPVGVIKLYFEGGDRIPAADVEISQDKSSWTKVGGYTNGENIAIFSCDAKGEKARYVRLKVVTPHAQQWFQLTEFEVYEPEMPIVENGKLYRIKNRYVDLSKSSTQSEGNGAYLSSTWVYAHNFSYGVSAEDIHCATQSKSDAGCVWTFIGDETNGWKIMNLNNGMYIKAEELLSNKYVHFTNEESEAALFTFESVTDTYYDIKSTSFGGTKYLNASNVGLQVTTLYDVKGRNWQFIPAEELEVTVSAAGYASIYLPFDVTLPSGLVAYPVTSTNKSYVSLTQGKSDIPANNGAILAGSGNYTLNIENATSDWTGNKLQGSNINTYVQGSAYVLGLVSDNVGLYLAELNKNETGEDGSTHFLNNANKAYLPASAVPQASQVQALFFNVGETTGVEEVEVESTVKTIYDLSGRKVSSMSAPGLYIVNGKKVLVK